MRSALIALFVAALLAPAVAAGQFQPLPPAPPPEPETVPAVPGSEGSGISGLQEAFLILAGVVLVVGIGVAITRDARRNAPAEARPGVTSGSSSAAGGVGERKKPDPRAAQKQKAAAKRARQARKKNRPTRK
ncbi:MAG: hypothetical protein M3417_11800 [Actinomycetota bacterium]|nr:hypothetical protein [Actinomycetota bacterium]